MIRKESISPVELMNATSLEGTQTCSHGIAEVTETNKINIDKFIACRTNSKSLRSFNIFRVTCKNSMNKRQKGTTCPTFLKTKRNNVNKSSQCFEFCFKFSFDFMVFCNMEPISYFSRNIKTFVIFLCFLVVLFIVCCIRRNLKKVKVSFWFL